jgi:peptide/nickel transport system substrate-binding protein
MALSGLVRYAHDCAHEARCRQEPECDRPAPTAKEDVLARNSATSVLIPVGEIGGKLDNDAPDYVFTPGTYLTLALAYDSLAAPTVHKDAQGVLQPGYDTMQPRLALGWDEQENGDWIVRLRPGVMSHAGNEFSAADLAWTLDRATAQGVMGCWRWREVVGVERIEILDRHSLRYCLRAPYPTFPNWLLSVSPNVLDSAAVKAGATADDPWAVGWLNGHVAGFGAYDLVEMNAERLRYEGRSQAWQGAPDPAGIEVQTVASRGDAIRLLDESRPVVLVGLDPDESVAMQKRGDVTVLRTWAGHNSVEIDFTQPPFDDIRVRHALACATPTDRIIREALLGQAKPWRSPVKSISQGYSERGWDFALDLDRARKLLRDAGYGDGLISDFYVTQRADSLRAAEIIKESWAKIGVALVLRDIKEAPPGWLPPLFLRLECGHNLSEPVYDIIHDYAAMNPIFPLPGGDPNVGNWRPRWKKNPEAIERIGHLLCQHDRGKKRAAFDDLQAWLTKFSSSIFIAEGQQVMVANRFVPPAMLSTEGRFYQALNHQNCTTNYLPITAERT